MVGHPRMPMLISVIQRRQLLDRHIVAGFFLNLAKAAELGESPTSAQPPGIVQSPSSRSRTSNIRSRSKTAARTSIFGVAYPSSALKRFRIAAPSGSPALAAIISAARRCISSVSLPIIGVFAVRQSILRESLKTPSQFNPVGLHSTILHEFVLPPRSPRTIPV